MRRMIMVFAAGLAVMLGAAGCGSKSTTSTSSTVDWANNLCSAMTTWKSSVDTAVKSVNAGNVSKETLQSAADQVTSANQTFVDSVKGLGKPGTKAGAQAKQYVDQLSTRIDGERQKIKTAVSGVDSLSGIIQAAPTVLGSLQAMQTDVSTTLTQLRKLDTSGELSRAFTQASACKAL